MKAPHSFACKFTFLIISVICAIGVALGQCPNDNIFWGNLDLEMFDEILVDDFFSGEYLTMDVCQGAGYFFSTCGSDFDTQITIYRESGEFVAYNDDSSCDVQSELNFVPGFSGTIRVLIDKYNCQNSDDEVVLSVSNISMPQELTLNDTFGDGWNGAVMTISDNQGVIYWEGTLDDGDSETLGLCLGYGCYTVHVTDGEYPGEIYWTIDGPDGALSGGPGTSQFGYGGSCVDECADPEACNFSIFSLPESVNCCFQNCLQMIQYDGFGDGWNNALFSIYDWNYSLVTVETLEEGAFGEDWLCLVDGCYSYDFTGGDYPDEIDWTLDGVHGGSISGGAPEVGTFKVGTLIFGCTDKSSQFYNPDANCDDGSCITGVDVADVGGWSWILSPNPNKGIFNLQIPIAAHEVNLTIYDDLGRLVHSQNLQPNLTNQLVETGKLSPGVYVVSCLAEEESKHFRMVID